MKKIYTAIFVVYGSLITIGYIFRKEIRHLIPSSRIDQSERALNNNYIAIGIVALLAVTWIFVLRYIRKK